MTSPESASRFPLGRPGRRRAPLGSSPLFSVHIVAVVVGFLTLIGTSALANAVKDAAGQLFSSGDDYFGTVWLAGVIIAFANVVLVEVLGTCYIAARWAILGTPRQFDRNARKREGSALTDT